MSVSISPNGRNLYESSSPSDELLVGSANGIVVLTRSGGKWSEARRELEGKHIASIAIDSASNTVFAGVHKGGFWVSEDGGKSWERRDNGMASNDIYGCNCVRVGDELRVYAGTEPAHLYVSTDKGRSWTDLPEILNQPSRQKWTFPAPPHEAHVKNIVFDPRDANTIYAGVEVGGAFKSTDAGKTWTEMSGFYEDVHRLYTVPATPDHVYMATGEGLYHSTDAGKNWAKMPLPEGRIKYPDALIVMPTRPDVVFTAGSIGSPGDWRTTKDADSIIARSFDGGSNWEYVKKGWPAHVRGNVEAMSMDVYPGGFSLFAGTTDGDVFFSDDEGENWTIIAQSLPPVSKGGHFRNLRDDAETIAAASAR
jgi:photosystem II stability/assembly factor-like uncharacterized protein